LLLLSGKKYFAVCGQVKRLGNLIFFFLMEIFWIHPSHEMGERKRMKILRIDPETDLPLTLFFRFAKAGDSIEEIAGSNPIFGRFCSPN
jgi:hypothetical protein